MSLCLCQSLCVSVSLSPSVSLWVSVSLSVSISFCVSLSVSLSVCFSVCPSVSSDRHLCPCAPPHTHTPRLPFSAPSHPHPHPPPSRALPLSCLMDGTDNTIDIPLPGGTGVHTGGTADFYEERKKKEWVEQLSAGVSRLVPTTITSSRRRRQASLPSSPSFHLQPTDNSLLSLSLPPPPPPHTPFCCCCHGPNVLLQNFERGTRSVTRNDVGLKKYVCVREIDR